MQIFLADLGHNQLTLSSDVYPLGLGNLAIYLQAYSGIKNSLDIKIFREPQELKLALDDVLPDVLGFSNYAWNQELSLYFARYAKTQSLKIFTLMGGPNFPLTTKEREAFLTSNREIDVFSQGPTYEGERAFLNVIQRFYKAGQSLEGLMEEPIPGNFWIDRKTGEFVQGAEIERIRNLDEIPSPYLAGVMDRFLKSGYFPMMQFTRGCPFSCSYCCSSVKSNNKITRHSVEYIKADLLYVAKRIHTETPLCLADDNFGMYPWDEEIADYIKYLRDRFNWPQYVRTTTGKNNFKRIIRVMRKTGGVLPMTAAVQSLNPVVLKNIKRSNISLNSFEAIQKEVVRQGLQSYGELILSLPGETKMSFMGAIEDLLDNGVKRISAHQLMLLNGAPLSTHESRKRWGFKTRFRIVARNIGEYDGQPIVETEEIVTETPTFSFKDYLDVRVFHLLMTIFYYEGNFEEAFKFAEQHGISPYNLIVLLKSTLDRAPDAFKQLIDDFTIEGQKELFNTKDECIAWAQKNFNDLVNGRVGGNLLSKYSMIGRFTITEESLDFLESAIMVAIEKSATEEKYEQLQAVIGYLRAVLMHVPFIENIATNPCWTTSYDIESWHRCGYIESLENYRYREPQTFSTIVGSKRRNLIKSRIVTFGETPSGLGKFTRTMFAQDLRREIVSARPK